MFVSKTENEARPYQERKIKKVALFYFLLIRLEKEEEFFSGDIDILKSNLYSEIDIIDTKNITKKSIIKNF